jgi:hypothetical protein
MDARGEEVNGFTACVLCFGNHVDLAHRCLGSICNAANPALLRSLRIGLNQACSETRALVREVASVLSPTTEVLVYDCGDHNRYKYPVMRKMFHDPRKPIITPFTMWFDDDSYLDDVDARWWSKIHQVMQTTDMLGALYQIRLKGNQGKAIVRQPWYNGKPLMPKFRFATGGWWTIRTRILQQFDYPFKDIVHNGGDTVLGELIRQQDLRLASFREGVRINADMDGRESNAPRRGLSLSPVWYNFPAAQDQRYHSFVLEAVDPLDERHFKV